MSDTIEHNVNMMYESIAANAAPSFRTDLPHIAMSPSKGDLNIPHLQISPTNLPHYTKY